MNQILLLLLSLLTLSAFSQKKLEKPSKFNNHVINEEGQTLKFQTLVADKKIKTKTGRDYYWYKANKLFNTEDGYYGHLLNGKYTAFYLNKNLKEQGKYKKGLKTGEWKTWYSDGNLETITNYKNGVQHGEAIRYENGEVIETIVYKKGKIKEAKEKFSFNQLKNAVAIKDKSSKPEKKEPTPLENKAPEKEKTSPPKGK